MRDIIIVEDGERNQEAAWRYFNRIPDINVRYASDHEGFRREFRGFRDTVEGAIVDCFFPESKGSEVLNLGIAALGMLLAIDTRNIGDADSLLEYLVRITDRDFMKGQPLSSFLEGEFGKKLFLNETGQEYTSAVLPYLRLAVAMRESEAYQPLGLFVSDVMYALDAPTILTLSSPREWELISPFDECCKEQRWVLFNEDHPGEYRKQDPEFWQKAYEELIPRIGLQQGCRG